MDIEDCWNKIGVWAQSEKRCPELEGVAFLNRIYLPSINRNGPRYLHENSNNRNAVN